MKAQLVQNPLYRKGNVKPLKVFSVCLCVQGRQGVV